VINIYYKIMVQTFKIVLRKTMHFEARKWIRKELTIVKMSLHYYL